MNTQSAYDLWSAQYDTNENKTRDLEGQALQRILAPFTFQRILEIGCGTGKNTEWLVERTHTITAVDLSEKMLSRARSKINSEKVEFIQADITSPWSFAGNEYDLITFSLVLEHIEHLDPIFDQVAGVLASGGMVYIGELHPFKQYLGSKARFDTPTGTQEVPCYRHNISEFVMAAIRQGLHLVHLEEFFDEENSGNVPRILGILFKGPE